MPECGYLCLFVLPAYHAGLLYYALFFAGGFGARYGHECAGMLGNFFEYFFRHRVRGNARHIICAYAFGNVNFVYRFLVFALYLGVFRLYGYRGDGGVLLHRNGGVRRLFFDDDVVDAAADFNACGGVELHPGNFCRLGNGYVHVRRVFLGGLRDHYRLHVARNVDACGGVELYRGDGGALCHVYFKFGAVLFGGLCHFYGRYRARNFYVGCGVQFYVVYCRILVYRYFKFGFVLLDAVFHLDGRNAAGNVYFRCGLYGHRGNNGLSRNGDAGAARLFAYGERAHFRALARYKVAVAFKRYVGDGGILYLYPGIGFYRALAVDARIAEAYGVARRLKAVFNAFGNGGGIKGYVALGHRYV